MPQKQARGIRLILGYLGMFIGVTGIICLLPLFCLIFYPEEAKYAWNFLIPGIGSIVLGTAMLFLIIKRERANLGKHQDAVLLTLLWVLCVVICATPYLFVGVSFTEAVFESVSGFATIGLTVFARAGNEWLFGVHIYTFYRAITAFFGGVGLVLVVTSTISDRYGLKLYVAEGHNDKLMPNLAKSARLILSIYVGYIVLGSVAFMIAGMGPFDSVCHSISAVATGGFSSRQGGFYEACYSIEGVIGGRFHACEIICIVLMLLGGTNFAIHLALITGKFKKVFRDCEIRLLVALIALAIPFFMLSVWLNHRDFSFDSNARISTFTIISALTTTGFTNFSGDLLPTLGNSTLYLILILTIVGGGAGSTAGGIKQYRVAVMAKSFYWSTREKLSNRRMMYPRFIWRAGEQKEVSAAEAIEAYSYSVLYIVILLVAPALMAIIEFNKFLPSSGDLITYGDCLFEFSNAISSTGLSDGLTAVCSKGSLWIMAIGMFIGRLEILPVYFALYRMVRDIFRKETV